MPQDIDVIRNVSLFAEWEAAAFGKICDNSTPTTLLWFTRYMTCKFCFQ